MHTLYNILISLVQLILPLVCGWSPKLKHFVQGRKTVFAELQNLRTGKDWVWFHVASLGEFEQAVPIIEAFKDTYPQYHILVSFYSPSGYINKKNHPLVDAIVYLPLDTPANAREFLRLVKPVMAFFIKYDIWPNFIKQLQREKVRTLLISGSFRKDQVYFKWYGGMFRKALRGFEFLFVQNEKSQELLSSIGITNVTVSGDTRFDRVSRQLLYDNNLEFVEVFKEQNLCLVAGSTWPEDEMLLLEYINKAPQDIKFIIAPHEIKKEKIDLLMASIDKPVSLYSQMQVSTLSQSQVLIVDTIGLLSKIYRYADIAYVGGAAGNSGLHNILEPATFGLPIIIGKNFEKFPEAKELCQLKGLFPVKSPSEFSASCEALFRNNKFREESGQISREYIASNTGATRKVMNYLKSTNG